MNEQEWKRAVQANLMRDPYAGKNRVRTDFNTEKIDKLSRQSFRGIRLLDNAISELNKAKAKFGQINKENKGTYDRYNRKELDRKGINRELKSKKRRELLRGILTDLRSARVAIDSSLR